MGSYRRILGLLTLGVLICTYSARANNHGSSNKGTAAPNYNAIQSQIDFLSALVQQQDVSIQTKLLAQQANLQSITPTSTKQANQIANRLAVIQIQLQNPPLPPAAGQLLRLDTTILNTLRSVNKQLEMLQAYYPRTPFKAQQQATRVAQLLFERTNLLVFNQEIDAAIARNAGTAFRAL